MTPALLRFPTSMSERGDPGPLPGPHMFRAELGSLGLAGYPFGVM